MVARIVTVGIITSIIIAVVTMSVVLVQFSQDNESKVMQSPQIKYEGSHSFRGDPLGNYEEWCLTNDGEWFDKIFQCSFEHKKDYLKATASLHDLKSHQINGKFAFGICDVVGLKCNDFEVFDGTVSLDDNRIMYSHVTKVADYDFMISDGDMHYKNNNAEVPEFALYDFSEAQILEEKLSRTSDYSVLFNFDGDELGNYEKWCFDNHGLFTKDSSNKVSCEFVTAEDNTRASKQLSAMKNHFVTGELAQNLCNAYQGDCSDDIRIGMKVDLRTGYMTKTEKIGEKFFEFRIQDSIIEFRPVKIPETQWTRL